MAISSGVPLTDIRKALGFSSIKEMKPEWERLTDTDKADIRAAVQSGSGTY